MAEISYIFGDLLTGQIIEEIRLKSVSFKMSLDTGEFRGTFYLDQTGKDNDVLMSATIPGRCYVVIERDGVVVGDYIVWTRTYQSQAKVCELYGIPFKDYSESRLANVDYSATGVEQRNVFLDVYGLMQDDPNSVVINLPSSTYDLVIARDLDIYASEYRSYRTILDSIADAADGFDWLVRTTRVGNTYYRTLDIGYPTIGSPVSDGIPVFEYTDTDQVQGGNINNYWCNDSMGSAATNFYGIGSGEGASMLVSPYTHTDLLASGFPRYDATYDRKDIDSQTTLDALTAQRAQLLKAPLSTITAEVKGDRTDMAFGEYGLGDACRLIITDPRFPYGLNKTTRMLGYEYTPPEDDNVEEVRLTFEGEDE